jgi:hypothetical protein
MIGAAVYLPTRSVSPDQVRSGVRVVVDRTLWLRHENQGQFSVIEIEGGDIAALNLGTISSYSAGGR